MNKDNSVESLLEEIDQISPQATDFDLWVPAQLTLRGFEVSPGVAMAVVLDRLLSNGFEPSGFTQEVNGRTYHYKKQNSN